MRTDRVARVRAGFGRAALALPGEVSSGSNNALLGKFSGSKSTLFLHQIPWSSWGDFAGVLSDGGAVIGGTGDPIPGGPNVAGTFFVRYAPDGTIVAVPQGSAARFKDGLGDAKVDGSDNVYVGVRRPDDKFAVDKFDLKQMLLWEAPKSTATWSTHR